AWRGGSRRRPRRCADAARRRPRAGGVVPGAEGDRLRPAARSAPRPRGHAHQRRQRRREPCRGAVARGRHVLQGDPARHGRVRARLRTGREGEDPRHRGRALRRTVGPGRPAPHRPARLPRHPRRLGLRGVLRPRASASDGRIGRRDDARDLDGVHVPRRHPQPAGHPRRRRGPDRARRVVRRDTRPGSRRRTAGRRARPTVDAHLRRPGGPRPGPARRPRPRNRAPERRPRPRPALDRADPAHGERRAQPRLGQRAAGRVRGRDPAAL
ncbi:MAG: hypothetical protein AVDCRST_MAG85-1511, partial [uncultured Solirubrobacteraceae bacterium]